MEGSLFPYIWLRDLIPIGRSHISRSISQISLPPYCVTVHLSPPVPSSHLVHWLDQIDGRRSGVSPTVPERAVCTQAPFAFPPQALYSLPSFPPFPPPRFIYVTLYLSLFSVNSNDGELAPQTMTRPGRKKRTEVDREKLPSLAVAVFLEPFASLFFFVLLPARHSPPTSALAYPPPLPSLA